MRRKLDFGRYAEAGRWAVVLVVYVFAAYLLLRWAIAPPPEMTLDSPKDTVYILVPPDSMLCETWRWMDNWEKP